MALEEPIQRRPVDIREPRRPRHGACCARNQPRHVFLLERGQHLLFRRVVGVIVQGRHVHRFRRLTPVLMDRDLLGLNLRAGLRQNDDVLDHILQFADVAAPGARHQEIEGGVTEVRRVILGGVVAHPETFEKVRRENRDVLDTIA